MSIVMKCPNAGCGKKLKVDEKMAGRSGQCPACGHPVQVPQAMMNAEPQPTPAIVVAKNPDVSTQDDPASALTKLPWIACFASIGALCLAATLPWVQILAGGVSGLRGDGLIVLGVSVIVCAILGFSLGSLKKYRAAALIACLAWGTFCTAWMFSLIWTVATGVPETGGALANAISAAIFTQIQPGVGLYVGVIGGVALAAAAWWAWVVLPKRGMFTERFAVALGAETLSLFVPLLLLIVHPHGGGLLPDRGSEDRRGAPFADASNRADEAMRNAEARLEAEERKKRESQTTRIGRPITVNNLEIVPLDVCLKRVSGRKSDLLGRWSDFEKAEMLVLTVRLKNVSKGELFDPINSDALEHCEVVDNFGNRMNALAEGLMSPFKLEIDGQTHKELRPGDSLETIVACDAPSIQAADRFTWNLRFLTSNQDHCSWPELERDNWAYLSFSKSEVKTPSP